MIRKFKLLAMVVTILIVGNQVATAKTSNFVDVEISDSEDLNSQVVNEYDLINNLKDLSTIELKAMGLPEDQIEDIKNCDYKSELYARSELGGEELSSYGYTDEEIKELQEYDGSEEQTRKLAPHVKIHSSLNSASASQFVIDFNWSWSSMPIVRSDDVIYCSWEAISSKGLPIDADIKQDLSYHNVTYKNIFTGKETTEKQDDLRINWTDNKARMLFEEGKIYKSSYACCGEGQIVLVESDIKEISMRFEYRHYQLFTKPKNYNDLKLLFKVEDTSVNVFNLCEE